MKIAPNANFAKTLFLALVNQFQDAPNEWETIETMVVNNGLDAVESTPCRRYVTFLHCRNTKNLLSHHHMKNISCMYNTVHSMI